MHEFQNRIGFTGDISPLLIQVCHDYRLGSYTSYEVVPVGYEDFNLVLTATRGKYFIKIFAAYRSQGNCKRYVGIIRRVLAARISHPILLKSSIGFLYHTMLGKAPIRLCVFEYINGQSLYDSKSTVNIKEAAFLIQQIAYINRIKLRPKFVYDTWAILNFLKEYKEKKQYLGKREATAISVLAQEFSKISFKKLPRALVHGDIIKTNILRDKRGKLFIIDFSVSNYYPRIQELAVLLCSVLFDERHPKDVSSQCAIALREYQKYIKLTDYEIKVFPLYCKVAHAMHVLQATFEKKVNKNVGKENTYWLRLGEIGLGII